jgi:hypothetical protein
MLRIGRWAVVAVWVVLLLALARSHWPDAVPEPAPLPPLAVAVDADDAWMGVYMRGQKVGYSHSQIRPVDGGYRLHENSFLRLTVLNQEQTVRIVTTAQTGEDFALRAFTVALDSGLGVLDVRGRVDKQALILQMGSGADASEQEIALHEPLYLPSAARARLRGDMLAAGKSMTVRIFDPSSMQHQALQIEVLEQTSLTIGASTVQTWKIRERFRDTETTVWLDPSGRTLREEGPMDMVVQREDQEQALNAGWGDAAFDLMAAVEIRVREPIADPRALSHLDARLAGLGETVVPTDARQSFKDGVLHIEREPSVAATYVLPYSESQWRGELAATPFLQIDHPRVQEAAREAVGDETDPRRAADRLRRWVHDELEKRPLASLPNAVQVLETRAGDCNEHAVLFAALARAVGLPARVVAGVVYGEDAFLYHAWNEVWLGNRWVSVDPAFDQMPADATHVKLIEGGPERHGDMMGLIGKLSIELLPESNQDAAS